MKIKINNQTLNYFLMVLLALSYFDGNSQTSNKKETPILEKGSYYGEDYGTKVKFKVLDNNKFEFVFYEGTFYQKGDSINFDAENVNKSNFQVKFSKENIIRPIVNLFIKSTMTISENRKFFVGFQKSAKSSIEYKSLIETEVDSPGCISSKMNSPLEIERMCALYLVTEDYGKTALIEKYVIPEDISDINIDFVIYPATPVNLVGKIDPLTGNLDINNNGEKSKLFSLNKNVIADETIKPNEKTTVKNWTYSGKIEDETDYLDYVALPAAEAKVSSGYELSENDIKQYKFKLKIEKTLKNALKENKKQKDKVLVIVYNQEEGFKTIISDYETQIGYDMYEKYTKEYDYFNFYNATKKDKFVLNKYLKDDVPCIIFVDGNGTQLFQTKSKPTNIGREIYTLKAIAKSIVLQAQFDAVVQNKKATTKQLIQAFTDVNNYTDEFLMVTETGTAPIFFPEGENLSEEVKKAVKETKEELIDSEAKAAEKVDAPMPPEVDEQLRASYDPEYTYKENVYKMISTKEEVNQKWLSILEKQNSSNLNLDVIKIAFDELNNSGFNNKLFNIKNSQNDFKILDFVLKNYRTVIELKDNENNGNIYIGNDDLIYRILTDLKSKIEENKSIGKEIYDVLKIKEYYKKLIIVSENNTSVIKEYLEALKELGLNQEFVENYNNYFQSIFKENTNLIEQLDLAYQKIFDFTEWKDFKNSFANDANSAAWQIVKDSTDKETIKKAIKWSEASLIIDKTSHYYFDTLAQLYYKNGEKAKAIATELKAIENAPKSDEESIKGYKDVLKKMKNGTY